jgi:hypothetical protein
MFEKVNLRVGLSTSLRLLQIGQTRSPANQSGTDRLKPLLYKNRVIPADYVSVIARKRNLGRWPWLM